VERYTVFRPRICTPPILTSKLRLEVSGCGLSGYPAIDAVRLFGYLEPQYDLRDQMLMFADASV
jgi:hypothetical protein